MLQYILQKVVLTVFTPSIIRKRNGYLTLKLNTRNLPLFYLFIFRNMALSKTTNSSTSNHKYENARKKYSFLQSMPAFRLYNALIYCGYNYVVSETLTANLYLSDLLVN